MNEGSNSLHRYKINKIILSSIGGCPETNEKECLSFQKLSDIVIFSIINTGMNMTNIEDIYGYTQLIESASFDLIPHLKFLKNNNIVVVLRENYKDEEFKFFYAGINSRESYIDLCEKLYIEAAEEDYFFIMYNPIFYNSIHHTLLALSTGDELLPDMKSIICRNIREAMYGKDAKMK